MRRLRVPRPLARLRARRRAVRRGPHRAVRAVRRRVSQAAAVVPLSACTVAEAPENVEDLVLGLWRSFDDEPEEVERMVRGALDVFDVETLRGAKESGRHVDLEQSDIEGLKFQDVDGNALPAPDVTETVPLYLTEILGCSLDEIAAIYVYDDQKELYGSNYIAYDRRFDDRAGAEAWARGEVDTASWEGSLTGQILLYPQYTYDFRTEARWVDMPSDLELPEDRVMLGRFWIMDAGAWVEPNRLAQDYQFEAFIPVGDGEELLHVYPIWRDLQIETLGTLEGPEAASINLTGMDIYGNQTTGLCQAGLPDLP